ncbi:MAG: AAA family ATPase [Deltaproteobacteria bacterium]|nr:AAA family ATPase [Deltaproteobacteria bacterium]
MSGDFPCWRCKAKLEAEHNCPKCEGTVCWSCGTCRCDYDEVAGAANAKKLDPRQAFQQLVDAAEELELQEPIDMRPIEDQVLAALACESGDPEAAAPRLILQQLRPEQFQDADNRVLADMLFPLARAGQPISRRLLVRQAKKKKAEQAAANLFAVAYDPELLPQHVAAIRDAARKKAALGALLPAGRATLDDRASTADVAGALGRARDHLTKTGPDTDYLTAPRTAWMEYANRAEVQQIGGQFLGYDTGFAQLNAMWNGLTSVLIALSGVPGTGKTTLLQQLAENVARANRIPSIYVTYEQSRDELQLKMVSRQSRVDCGLIQRGRLEGDSETWGQVQRAFAEVMAYVEFVHIIEADATTTVDKLQLWVEEIMHRHRTDQAALFVDYLQKVPVGAGHDLESRRDEVAFVTAELRRLVRDLHIPVVAISSMARQSYGKAGLDSFKESGEIEYTCDIAAVLQPDKDAEDEVTPQSRPIKLHVVKNRNGGLGDVKFTFYPNLATFVEAV